MARKVSDDVKNKKRDNENPNYSRIFDTEGMIASINESRK